MSSHEASEPFGNKSPTKPRKSKKTTATAAGAVPEAIRDSSPQAVVESVPNPTDPTAEPAPAAAPAAATDATASVSATGGVRARVNIGGTAASHHVVPAAAENSPAPQPPLVPPMMSSAAGTPNRSAAGTPRGDGMHGPAGAAPAAPEGLQTPPRGPTSPPAGKSVVSPAGTAAAPSKRLNMELPPLAVSSMRTQASVGEAGGGADTSRATMDTARAGNTTPHGPVAATGGVPASPGRGPNTPGRSGVPPPGWTPLPGGGYRCSNPNCKRVHYPNGTPIASPMRQGSTAGTPTGGTPTARAAPPAQQTGEAFPSSARAPVSVAVQRQGSVQAGTPVVGTPVGKDKLDNTMMSLDDAYALGYMGPRMPPLIGERTVYPLWVLCTALSIGLGFALIVTMSMLLAASSNIPRTTTLFVPVGVVMLLVGIFLVCFGVYCARNRVVQRTPGGYSLGGLAARGLITLAMGAVFAFCLAVVVFGAVIHIQNRQRAPYDVDYTKLTGLQGSSVSISRDKDGSMTHIIAANRNDAYFGLGFAEAQDRLFQLQFSRLVMRGLLAAEFGPDAYESDRLARTMNWVGRAELSLDSLDTTQRSYLDSMCAGINQYLAKEWVLPPEFAFLGGFLSYTKPAAFEPLDLVLSFMMFQFALTTNVHDEIQRWQFWSSTSTPADFSYAELAALFKDTHSGAVGTFTDILPAGAGAAAEATSMAAEETLYDGTLASYRVTTATPARAEFAGRAAAAAAVDATAGNVESHDADGHPETKSGGAMLSRIFRSLAASNAWAARAASANVVGASDPHLAMAMPSAWYNVHLRIEDEDFDVWGSTMPGVPAILNGRTSFVRWGNTMSMTDTADIFVTEPDATRPDTHYTKSSVSTKYDIRHEYIEVYGESTPRLVRVRSSSYGPDISTAFKLRTANGAALCLSLPGLDEDLNSLSAFMKINTPANTDVTTMQTLLQKIQAPALTTVYSDESGAMGATITGTHPIRASGHTGRVPILGNGNFDYAGTVPTATMPTTTDATGTATFLFAANSNPTPTGFTPVLGYDYAEDYRAQLIKEKLTTAQSDSPASLSEADFHKALQLDKTSGIWLKFFKPTIGADTAFTGRLTGAGVDAWAAMMAWDGIASVGSIHPSRLWVWAVTMMSAEPLFAALEHVQGDGFELSSAFARRILTSPTTRQLELCAAANGNAVTGSEACKAWAAAAFSAVAARDSMEWGNNVATVNGKHPLLEGHVAGPLFGRYLAKGGDPSSIDSVGFASKDGVRVGALGPLDLQLEGSVIPSVRWVYESSASDKVSHLSMPGGNSGQPYRAEYFNMAEDYQAGTYTAVYPITAPAKRKQTLEKKK